MHEQVVLDTGGPMPRLRTVVIPHGPYRFPDSGLTASAARRQLGLPDGPPLLLAFGHIRDNKNLDLLLRALVEVPEVHLVVAGQELSSGQKPVAFYRRLAEELGLADRCHWFVRYVQPEEAAVFFRAADLVALTYAAGFRSASGVLNASIHFRRPCLASSGPSPLKTLVTKYDLGLWVPPDDTDALAAGLRQLLAGGPAPRWNDYLRDNSWERNARIVADTLFAK